MLHGSTANEITFWLMTNVCIKAEKFTWPDLGAIYICRYTPCRYAPVWFMFTCSRYSSQAITAIFVESVLPAKQRRQSVELTRDCRPICRISI